MRKEARLLMSECNFTILKFVGNVINNNHRVEIRNHPFPTGWYTRSVLLRYYIYKLINNENFESRCRDFTSEMQFPFSCLITPPLRYVYKDMCNMI